MSKIEAIPITAQIAKSFLPKRKADSHKGSYGKLALICGSDRFPGAAVLAVKAALRSGVGYTTLYASSTVRSIVLTSCPECVCYPIEALYTASPALEPLQGADAVVFGPGVGQSEQTEALLWKLLSSPISCPILIDADGINLMAKKQEKCKELFALKTKNLIFTPHPLEFSRLFGVELNDLLKNRAAHALLAADISSAIVLLKGHRTLVASPASVVWENTTGSCALAKAGSGDVLAGLIGGFLAQGITPSHAAALGAYLHGEAGDILEAELSSYGVTPSDLPLAIAKRIYALQNAQEMG